MEVMILSLPVTALPRAHGSLAADAAFNFPRRFFGCRYLLSLRKAHRQRGHLFKLLHVLAHTLVLAHAWLGLCLFCWPVPKRDQDQQTNRRSLQAYLTQFFCE